MNYIYIIYIYFLSLKLPISQYTSGSSKYIKNILYVLFYIWTVWHHLSVKPYRQQTHSCQHIEICRLSFVGFLISSAQGWIHRITSCASIYCLPWEINKSGSRTYDNQCCYHCFKEWQPAGSLKSECVLEFSSLTVEKWLLRGLINCRCGLFFFLGGHLLTILLTDGLFNS